MKSTTILIDDVPTVIRPMGEDYVVGEDPGKSGINYAIKCWPGKDVPGEWPNKPIAVYFRKVMQAYGTAAITAWQENTLVGFLPFMPVSCDLPDIVFCVVVPEQHQTSLDIINAANPTSFDQLTPRILRVQCASVTWDLYRKGLGSSMARYLVEWARIQGWERIEGWAYGNPDVDDAYKWIPSIEFWEKAGFVRGSACEFEPDDHNLNKPAFNFFINLQDC